MEQNIFEPETKDELMAQDIAYSLRDIKHLPLYLKFSRMYSHDSLIKILGEVKEIPDERIKKSKGALFTYLVMRRACKKRDIEKHHEDKFE